jgi:hypothetical protein
VAGLRDSLSAEQGSVEPGDRRDCDVGSSGSYGDLGVCRGHNRHTAPRPTRVTRAGLFLIAFAALAIAAIGHPSLGAGAIYPGEMAPLEEGGDVSTSVPATSPAEEPSSTDLLVSDDPVEAPTAELPVESPAPEPPVESPIAESPPAEPPTAEPPPLEIATTESPPLETPTAESVDTGEVPPLVTEGLKDPAGGAPVATLPAAPEAAVQEEPELAPVAEPGLSVVIRTSSEGESLRPITGELRAVLLVDAPTTLTRLADVSSVGTTTRTASGRPARGSVERPSSEVGWLLQIPSPSAPPVPSRLDFTFNEQAPTGGSFRADLALALSVVVFAFSLMARVARPVNSRLLEAALVTRVPQPG